MRYRLVWIAFWYQLLSITHRLSIDRLLIIIDELSINIDYLIILILSNNNRQYRLKIDTKHQSILNGFDQYQSITIDS